MQLSKEQFKRTLNKAITLTECHLLQLTGAKRARSYFVIHQDRAIPMKAAVRLGYLDNNILWDGPHSSKTARILSSFEFQILYDREDGQRLDRQKRISTIWARPEQQRFRSALLQIFGSKCALTSCNVLDAIDAAHIKEVNSEGACVPRNGIILRADLHRLFDRNMLAFDPKTGEAHFHEKTRPHYENLHGQRVTLPSKGPTLDSFRDRWGKFNAKA